jgi:hypothetical protein
VAGRRKSKQDTGKAGSLIRRDHKDGPQYIRDEGHRWNERAEAIFLDHLAASSNVSWSAAQAGFVTDTVYKYRRRDPAFAAKWQVALEQGYARLEMELVRTGTEYLAGLKLDPKRPIKEISVRDAIQILGMHHSRRSASGRLGERFESRPKSLDEVKESILAKLEAIELERRARLALPKPDPDAEPSGEADGET